MLLPASVVLYFIRLSTITDMLLYYYCRRLAKRYIFHTMSFRSIVGVNHLIAFEANLLIISHNHSMFACRSFLSSRHRSHFFQTSHSVFLTHPADTFRRDFFAVLHPFCEKKKARPRFEPLTLGVTSFYAVH